MGEPRRILGDELQLLQARRIGLEQGIAQRLRQRREKPVAFAGRKLGDVDLELLRECQQYRRRYGTLIVLDLVEIARGDADALGELPLGQSLAIPQIPNLAADIKLADRHARSPFRNFAICASQYCMFHLCT